MVEVESRTGVMSLAYHTMPASEGRGFNATYRISGYCLPWEGVCGGSDGGCYTQKQQCDGHWDCAATGRDEEGCGGCPKGHFLCGAPGASHPGHYGSRPVCFTLKDRCNYQLNCVDGSDERECTICQPGTFHCDMDRYRSRHHPTPSAPNHIMKSHMNSVEKLFMHSAAFLLFFFTNLL